MAEPNDITTPPPLLYTIFTSPSGGRCVREFYGERYVLVRVLPAYPNRLGWVKEDELNPTALPALALSSFPSILPPVRGARLAHG
jgi:hypothetical protein